MSTALFEGLLRTGAPWGILCAVLLVAVVALWRRSILLSDKLIILAESKQAGEKDALAALGIALRELGDSRRYR